MTNIYPGVGWATDHKQVPVKHPSGREIPVDEEIAPLLSLVWDRGIDTTTSCQSNASWADHEEREEWALIGFSSAEDAQAFVRALALTESDEDESLFQRVSGTVMDEDELEMHERNWDWLIWFQPHEQVRPDFKMRVELRFPRSDLPEVMERLAVEKAEDGEAG